MTTFFRENSSRYQLLVTKAWTHLAKKNHNAQMHLANSMHRLWRCNWGQGLLVQIKEHRSRERFYLNHVMNWHKRLLLQIGLLLEEVYWKDKWSLFSLSTPPSLSEECFGKITPNDYAPREQKCQFCALSICLPGPCDPELRGRITILRERHILCNIRRQLFLENKIIQLL